MGPRRHLLAILVVLAACGGSSDPPADDVSDDRGDRTTRPEAQPTSEASTGPPDAAVEYLELLASDRLADLARMTELSAAGSPAELYATYQLAQARYYGPTPATSEPRGNAVEQCIDRVDTSGDTETECATFGEFEVDDAGKLVTFSIEDNPIAGRLTAGDPAGAAGEALHARVLAAYATGRGDLSVALDVTNTGEGVAMVDDCAATYVGPDSRQVTQTCESTQPRVQPQATTTIVYLFEQTAPGGTMTVTAATDEREPGTFYGTTPLDVTIPG